MEKLTKTITETVQTNTDQVETLSARGYQTELLEQAKLENLIVCLPTGSGKTYIAVMLIKDMAMSIRPSLREGGKRTIFLVKTVQLVEQQSDYIKTHTDLVVGCYYGELGVDLWQKERWDMEFETHQVLVFTAQVFLNILDHDFFPLSRVNLIIFDECHHATGDNQYAALMHKHYDQCLEKPRVLGLTASISNKKIQGKDLANISKELEKTYRARIESGSKRAESIRHGTSVTVHTQFYSSYRETILKEYESLTIPFDFLRSMANDIQNFVNRHKDKQKQLENDLSTMMLNTNYHGQNLGLYQKQSSAYTILVQSPINILINFKRNLDNLSEVGHELGLAALFFFAKELRKRVQTYQQFLVTDNRQVSEIFRDILERLTCLVEDILTPLHSSYSIEPDVLCSPKVLALLERIISQHELQRDRSKCIVFVERVHTATMLSRVLSKIILARGEPWNRQLKVKHVTGTKTVFGDAPMTAKNQKQTIKAFRTGDINILIATAVVEEGLDIPTCDLVVRFNKPTNFSSYMQSKGRARAKKNASYILFLEEKSELLSRDQKEYSDYEELEKMIQRGFSRDGSDENVDEDLKRIPSYRPSANVVIDATRAAQLIMEYCVLLGNGQLFPPRFLFHGVGSPYKCILSMPANCPVRNDITCQREKKKLAKYECCLEMVKKLHETGELNEHCLPNRYRAAITIETPIGNKIFKLVDELFEAKTDSSFEIFEKQIATFPTTSKEETATWHLYKINAELGFVIPRIIEKLPKFYLYNPQEVIDVQYLKAVQRPPLDEFSSYLFQCVFDGMNTPTLLQLDMKNSSFQLYPCLLTASKEIDYSRMRLICSRGAQLIRDYSELNEKEVYTSITSPENVFYKLDRSAPTIRGSEPWPHRKCLETIQTYDDYFAHKYETIVIEKNARLAPMCSHKKPNINYFRDSAPKEKEDGEKIVRYYPLEYLRYAALNEHDYQLIFKLPATLYRISQLYRIEQLRKRIAENMKVYLCQHTDQMPIVTFQDCLRSNTNPSLLPLIPLTYERTSSHFQPSPDILFQATTRRSAGECTDMENLEILGDCFLKLTVSLSLYHQYPLASAGALTVEKAKQISNGNLYRIAVQKKFKSYLNVIKNDFRGERANWIPPGYSPLTQDKEIVNRYMNQDVKRKAFADMMEGLIGAYLVATDYARTMQFMAWLGLDVFPEETAVPSIVCSSIEEGEIELILMNFYSEQNFAQVEEEIKYQFVNKAYLIAAFTHPSSFANRLTACYERLEFLGDAVLDFLVTRHVFVENKNITPGRVTDIRQDLSNNGRLAYLLVAHRLHQKILHNSPDLFGKISEYAGDEELFPKVADDSMETESNKDFDQWADSTAPKALADVFEALVGAIFLDSGKCLKTVWKVIEPLLREYLHQSVQRPNLNPVRTFFEHGGRIVVEGTETDPKTETTRSVCVIEARNGYYIRGHGDNRKTAKFDACRKAVKNSFV